MLQRQSASAGFAEKQSHQGQKHHLDADHATGVTDGPMGRSTG